MSTSVLHITRKLFYSKVNLSILTMGENCGQERMSCLGGPLMNTSIFNCLAQQARGVSILVLIPI